MKYVLLCVLAVWALAGCRAPMPSFKDFSPYRGTRIDPPATSSYGTTDSNYYQEPPKSGQAPANTRSDASALPDSVVQNQNTDSTALGWKTSGRAADSSRGRSTVGASISRNSRGTVVPATYEEEEQSYAPGTTNTVKTTWQIIDASPISETEQATPRGSTASRGIKMNGMPVNDATSLSEPAPFRADREIRDISELAAPSPAIRARIQRESASSASNATTVSEVTGDSEREGWRAR